MNTIRQIKKSRFVGFTVLVASLAMIATLFAAAANPGPWVNAGQWAWRIISGAGTMITYGQLLNEINKPNNTESRLRARPLIKPNLSIGHLSSAYNGTTYQRSELFPTLQGNYERMWANYEFIALDEDATMGYRVMGYRSVSAPSWIPERTWDAIYASPISAVRNSFFERWWEDDFYSRGGIWLTQGESYKFEYPPITVESDCYNPDWFGTTLDGELVATSKKHNLTYDARIHCKLQKLTWVVDSSGIGNWVGGDWVTNNLREPKYTINFPGYEDDATKSGIAICPQNYRIKDEEVRGGMDIWWNRNVNHVNAVVETQALDSQGDPTGPVTRHEAMPQKNIEWVIDYSRLPN